MKTVPYPGNHGDRSNPHHAVAYRVYAGRRIVFTGIYDGVDGPRGSTINFAEEIVLAIGEKEKIDPRLFTFYDLQTCTGYPAYRLGDYRFNELRPKWQMDNARPVSMGWIEDHCPEDIMEDFVEFVWKDSTPDTPRNLAVAHGAVKPLLSQTPSVSA